jgi:phospholipase/lecithinase/hemolysin
MPKKLLITLSCCVLGLALQAKPGIKGIVVFGDSLSDAGNVPGWSEIVDDPTVLPQYPEPYYMWHASNGPTWIEIVANAYGYHVDPIMDLGSNFAFGGAESGAGRSDQDTPNFHTQIGLYQRAINAEVLEPPMPWILHTVWFGPNDFLRIMETEQRPVTPEDVEAVVTNIAQGIGALYDMHARMFLVIDMPPLHLTPYGMSQPPEVQAMLAQLVMGFNAGLAQALDRVENAYDRITILRLDAVEMYTMWTSDPESFGLVNVMEPALNTSTGEVAEDPDTYLSWDGFHPTVAGHALVAQAAMDIIPIGSWWGHSVARGPMGTAWTGMGWVNDEHWPWLFSYSMNDDGAWMWAYEEGGDIDGFYAYIPKGYKWVFMNAMSGWYYDYSAGMWMPSEM